MLKSNPHVDVEVVRCATGQGDRCAVGRATDFGSAKSVLLAVLLAGLLACSAAHALAGQMPPDYGLAWKTIGAAGNRGTLASETPQLSQVYPGVSLGSVGYEFRLTKTELTRAQWYEFVQAYLPYYDAPTPYWTNIAFVGSGFIGAGGTTYLSPGRPANMSWEYAARYCNWLHNGKANTREAFAQGVYDTTTFTRNPDGSFNHNLTRAPGAKYWIPSLDEWVKGAYYDPDKYGPGQEGYWLYPGMSDVPLIPGPPSAGGQTNAGPFSLGSPLNAGSYPNIQSPWGLLDNSGGESELLDSSDTRISDSPAANPHVPFDKGTFAGAGETAFGDMIDRFGGVSPNSAGDGLRLASSVPSPGIVLIPMASFTILLRRSRPCGRALSRSSSGSSPVCIRRPPWGP